MLKTCFFRFKPPTYKKEPIQLFYGELHMVDVLKKSGVREAAGDLNVGSDFYEELDERVKKEIQRAVERAQANNRKTVKARDV